MRWDFWTKSGSTMCKFFTALVLCACLLLASGCVAATRHLSTEQAALPLDAASAYAIVAAELDKDASTDYFLHNYAEFYPDWDAVQAETPVYWFAITKMKQNTWRTAHFSIDAATGENTFSPDSAHVGARPENQIKRLPERNYRLKAMLEVMSKELRFDCAALMLERLKAPSFDLSYAREQEIFIVTAYENAASAGNGNVKKRSPLSDEPSDPVSRFTIEYNPRTGVVDFHERDMTNVTPSP